MHSRLLSSSSSAPSHEGRSGYKLVPLKCGAESGLPLVPCPKCGEEILELVAAARSKVPRAVFFKCRLHERDVAGSCPWYMFADKYKRMLIEKGLIQVNTVETEQPVAEVSDEATGLQVAAAGTNNGFSCVSNDVEALKASIGGLDEKLKKLVVLGHIGVVCIVLVSVCVAVGVIRMLLK